MGGGRDGHPTRGEPLEPLEPLAEPLELNQSRGGRTGWTRIWKPHHTSVWRPAGTTPIRRLESSEQHPRTPLTKPAPSGSALELRERTQIPSRVAKNLHTLAEAVAQSRCSSTLQPTAQRDSRTAQAPSGWPVPDAGSGWSRLEPLRNESGPTPAVPLTTNPAIPRPAATPRSEK